MLEHEPGDLTCVVEAGLRLTELSEALAPHGQRFSLDPPGDPTVGECLLENLSGPLSHRFGTMRDLVLGIVVVLPDGTPASSGGKVVKNVAGYDLGKLFCGSFGRLGRVDRLALRLHPLPAVTSSIVTDMSWPELHNSTLVPSAVDLAHGVLHVLFEGSERAVADQVRRVGGEEADRWDALRELQQRLPGRVRWDGGDAPLVRPGPGVAYVAQPAADEWGPLAERVRKALCSRS